MYDALVIYKTALAKNPNTRVPRYLGECMQLIATNLAKKSWFSGYSYKDEMIADAVENCLKYIDRFDHERWDNPFAYFTQTVKNAFFRRIEVEKKEAYIKHKLLDRMSVDLQMTSEDSEFMVTINDQYDTEKLRALYESVERKTKKVKPETIGIEQFAEMEEDTPDEII